LHVLQASRLRQAAARPEGHFREPSPQVPRTDRYTHDPRPARIRHGHRIADLPLQAVMQRPGLLRVRLQARRLPELPHTAVRTTVIRVPAGQVHRATAVRATAIRAPAGQVHRATAVRATVIRVPAGQAHRATADPRLPVQAIPVPPRAVREAIPVPLHAVREAIPDLPHTAQEAPIQVGEGEGKTKGGFSAKDSLLTGKFSFIIPYFSDTNQSESHSYINI